MSVLTISGASNIAALERSTSSIGLVSGIEEIRHMFPSGLDDIIRLAYNSMFDLTTCSMIRTGQQNSALADWRDQFYQDAESHLFAYMEDFHMEGRAGSDLLTLYLFSIEAIIKSIAPDYPAYAEYINSHRDGYWSVVRTNVQWHRYTLKWIVHLKSESVRGRRW